MLVVGRMKLGHEATWDEAALRKKYRIRHTEINQGLQDMAVGLVGVLLFYAPPALGVLSIFLSTDEFGRFASWVVVPLIGSAVCCSAIAAWVGRNQPEGVIKKMEVEYDTPILTGFPNL